MPSGEDDARRAQLWSIYFGLRGLTDPPPFLLRARDELKAYLEGDPGPVPTRVLFSRGHLSRVK